ncbi:MAG TPA: amidohydrolase family protein [Polyangiales bacterium]|nr:amidohydrolase family protein [Polyangiales bacterium]
MLDAIINLFGLGRIWCSARKRRCHASAVRRTTPIPSWILAALCVLASGCLARFLGGDYHDSQPYAFMARIHAARDESDMTVMLVRRARALLHSAERDGVRGAPHDHHFHLIGFASGRRLACAELLDAHDRAGLREPERLPELRFSEDNLRLHPDYDDVIGVRTVLRQVLANANRIDDDDRANEQYLKRILDLAVAADLGGTYYLYAFDYRFDPPGLQPSRDRSDLYVSNDYAIAVAECLTQLAKHLAAKRGLRAPSFEPVASVHPHRPDALSELERLAKLGVRHLKWLPPAQHIDPADPRLDPFYRALAEHGIVLLSHTGKEHTLRVADGDEDLGNPLRLRRALEAGVTVVMLHAGREGEEQSGARRSYFERFLQMMREPTYRGRLFGEISVLPYVGTQDEMAVIFADPELRCRMLDGSDYPNPALHIVRMLSKDLFASRGPLRWSDAEPLGALRARRDALDTIRRQNPVLYDFVLKRSLRFRIQGRLEPLPDAVFYDLPTKLAHPQLGCSPIE